MAFVSAATLVFAAWRDEAFEPGLLFAALLIAIAGWAAGSRAPRPSVEVAVDDAGQLAVRRVAGADGLLEQGLQRVFAAPWLITLRCGTMWVRIWPDSVPGDVFRRLWVHVRWNQGRHPREPIAAAAPGRER